MKQSRNSLDHPIFQESIQFIRSNLQSSSPYSLENQVLERLIHTSGDFAIEQLLKISPGACQIAIAALRNGASILTDTKMVSVAITSMASRTINCKIDCLIV